VSNNDPQHPWLLEVQAQKAQRRPKLQGDAPLTPWELEKVRADAEMAARYIREQKP
jgi:hypothetical protein